VICERESVVVCVSCFFRCLWVLCSWVLCFWAGGVCVYDVYIIRTRTR